MISPTASSIGFRRSGFVALVLIASGLPGAIEAAPEATLVEGRPRFEERVRCQRAIEEVYWRHRIWPPANPAPKPALDEILTEGAIRERVTTQLQKSAALRSVWSRPLTGLQLQAELDRMVRGTRNAQVLRELFAALDDDPFLVAECLARPALTERLTRNWYARDARFHGELRTRIEAGLVRHPNDPAGLLELGGTYSEREWRLETVETPGANFDHRQGEAPVLELSAEEWQERIVRLARSLGVDPGPSGTRTSQEILARIPLNRRSPLTERDDAFLVTSVLSIGPDRVRIATVHWTKQSYDSWWTDQGRGAVLSAGGPVAVAPPSTGYELRSPDDDGCSIDTWTELWFVPTPRTDHSAVWTGAEMIVWGGYDGETLSTGGRYDPATDTWTETSNVDAPHARTHHTAVWSGSEMIVWGGEFPGAYVDTGGRYDPTTNSWTATSTWTGVPDGRRFHSAVWTGTEMIVWGGRNVFGNLDTGGRYEPAGDSWTPTSTGSGVPAARYGCAALWTGSRMIVWGGNGPGAYVNTGAQYDPVTDSWTATSTGPGVPLPRNYFSSVWTGTEMIVWGGRAYFGPYNYDFTNTGGRYDPATDSWTATSTGTGTPIARAHHTAVWSGTEMIVWGALSSTGARYDPAGDSWTVTSTSTGVPPTTQDHTAVWTGTQMIVWGGFYMEDLYRNTGGRYDPVSDSWLPTAIGPAGIKGRVDPSAVWTGSEMIVWGGYDPYEYMSSGGRYDPATDNWTTTPMYGAPTPRYTHSAVWTGTEMIVWGGGAGFGEDPSTGGRYDPLTYGWTATSTAGAPMGRKEATVVWTGSEMIVWGGREAYYVPPPSVSWYVPVNSGGRYDPSTDTWEESSTGPAARYDHTAIWTGAAMIVWGGTGSAFTSLDTGGHYDPTSDSWTAVAIGGAPAARSSHHSVWTGTEMIVWGGPGRDTGGRYDPSTDSWSATATGPPAPIGTRDGTAVWTGDQMIVWGGERYGTPYDTGGRYDPAHNSWTATSTGAGVPVGTSGHAAVWTGREMIIWGGDDDHWAVNSGGLYCACEGGTVVTWYPDMDGDGYGSASTGVPSCSQPPGHILDGGDCDDSIDTCAADCVTNVDADGIKDCADYCLDADGDLYGAPGGAGDLCRATDCDDTSTACTIDCSDPDEDSVPDCRDNCPGIHNPAQTDIDADGWGEADGCDCNDLNYNIYPGAMEINDGGDNQCPGDEGYGLIDEIETSCGFHNPDDLDEFSWTAQPRATSYRVARSADPRFETGCLLNDTPQTSWVDTDPVPEGACFHYLVRASSPRVGSWGADSDGVDRTGVCP